MNKNFFYITIFTVIIIIISGCSAKKTFYFSTDQFKDTYETVSKDEFPDNIIVKDASITLNDGTIDQAVYVLHTLERTLNNQEFITLSEELLAAKGIFSSELVASKVYVGISAENEGNIRINILPDDKAE